MKDRDKIVLGLTSVAATVAVVVLLTQKKKKVIKNIRLSRIADEGYETAGDILYPIRYKAESGLCSS